MTHTKEPWVASHTESGIPAAYGAAGEIGYTYTGRPYNRPIIKGDKDGDIPRAVACVNALAGIANPEDWVKAAKRLSDGVRSKDGYKDMIEAVLDMKAAETDT